MVTLPPSVRLFVATTPVDGRKGFDALSLYVQSHASARRAKRSSVCVFQPSPRCRQRPVLGPHRLCAVEKAAGAWMFSPPGEAAQRSATRRHRSGRAQSHPRGFRPSLRTAENALPLASSHRTNSDEKIVTNSGAIPLARSRAQW